MGKKNINSPATKQDLMGLGKRFDEKLGHLGKRFDEKLNGLDKKFEKGLKEEIRTSEEVLRFEIQQSAKETKKEIKEEIKRSESRILDVLDEFVGELKASREERTIAAGQIAEVRGEVEAHEHRIASLEKKISSLS